MILAGSVSFAGSFVYARKFVSPLRLTPLALTAYQIGIALALLGAATEFRGIGAVFTDTRASVGLVLGLGLCGTGLAAICFCLIVDRLGAVAASGVTYIPPVVALAVGAVMAKEPVAGLDIAAMVIILSGVAVLQSGRDVGSRAVAGGSAEF